MSARNQRLRPPPPRRPAARGNARFPERDRRHRLASRAATHVPRQPIAIPLTWLNTVVGLMLLPVTIVTSQAFYTLVSQGATAHGVWRTAPLFLFLWGLLVWIAAFWAGLRPRYLYVLGHELTHALFVLLCGGKIHEFRVSGEGGHVVTNKNNLLISLSPYFVPFWSLVVVTVYGLLGFFVDLSMVQHLELGGRRFSIGPQAFLCFFLGYTWGLHLTFTLWMVGREQPDLQRNGTFFSLVFIYFVNLVLILSLFIAVSPEVSVGQLIDVWTNHLKSLVGSGLAAG